MPRTRPKSSSPRYLVYPHPLSEQAKTELRSCLNLDYARSGSKEHEQETELADKAFAEVERILGGYTGAVGALDNEPRAADYRDRLTPIRGTPLT
jgi:hypothetical protein